MPGTVIPGTNIVVDTFRHGSVGVGGRGGAAGGGSSGAGVEGCRTVQHVYFLTHAHADHTVGLSPTWDLGTIFCSHVTRSIILRKFGLDPQLVVGLDMDEEHTVNLATASLVRGPNASADDGDGDASDSGGSGSSGSGTHVQVTLIDANHCPGAAMMLFRGYFGVVLHTGDFRYTPAMATHPALAGVSIDHLYIDNTYCHPQYTFPPRREAAQAVVDLIRLHPTHRVVLGVDTLGKEELLHYVATELGMPVQVPPARYETIKLLGYPEYLMPGVFTTRRDAVRAGTTRLVMHPRHAVSSVYVARLNDEDVLGPPTIAVVPSGWCAPSTAASSVGACGSVATADGATSVAWPPIRLPKLVTTSDHLCFRVPYSLHSSYTELVQAVRAWRPRAVTGTSVTTTEAVMQLRRMSQPLLDPSPPSVPAALRTLPATLRNPAHGADWQRKRQARRVSCRKGAAAVRSMKHHQRERRRAQTALARRRSALLRRRWSVGPADTRAHAGAAATGNGNDVGGAHAGGGGRGSGADDGTPSGGSGSGEDGSDGDGGNSRSEAGGSCSDGGSAAGGSCSGDIGDAGAGSDEGGRGGGPAPRDSGNESPMSAPRSRPRAKAVVRNEHGKRWLPWLPPPADDACRADGLSQDCSQRSSSQRASQGSASSPLLLTGSDERVRPQRQVQTVLTFASTHQHAAPRKHARDGSPSATAQSGVAARREARRSVVRTARRDDSAPAGGGAGPVGGAGRQSAGMQAHRKHRGASVQQPDTAAMSPHKRRRRGSRAGGSDRDRHGGAARAQAVDEGGARAESQSDLELSQPQPVSLSRRRVVPAPRCDGARSHPTFAGSARASAGEVHASGGMHTRPAGHHVGKSSGQHGRQSLDTEATSGGAQASSLVPSGAGAAQPPPSVLPPGLRRKWPSGLGAVTHAPRTRRGRSRAHALEALLA